MHDKIILSAFAHFRLLFFSVFFSFLSCRQWLKSKVVAKVSEPLAAAADDDEDDDDDDGHDDDGDEEEEEEEEDNHSRMDTGTNVFSLIVLF